MFSKFRLLGALAYAGMCMAAYGAQFTVATTAAAGAGSLRQAILDANASAETNVIVFQLPGSPPFTITPTNPLPSLGTPTLVDGASQTGFAGAPLIEINGASAGSGAVGLQFLSSGCGVRALVINRFTSEGVVLTGSSNTVQGCYIGTDVTGQNALGNTSYGIWVKSQGNLIGGTNAGDGNLISANNTGIYLSGASSNIIWGNRVGVKLAGTNALPNANDGIMLDGSSGNRVGGPNPAMRNLISGNGRSGIVMNTPNARNNLIQGNFIGLDLTGSRALRNGGPSGGDGITVNGAAGNTIGGLAAGCGNVISANAQAGVRIEGAGAVSNVLFGNFIGTDAAGKAALGNTNGVVINAGSANQIGGVDAGSLNVISGNVTDGIFLTNATGNVIQGNHIGLSAAGTNAVANGLNGITLNGASSNTIGGTVAGARNIISGNGANGVGILKANDTGNVILGNYIGTDVAGLKAVANLLSGVRIEASSNTVGGLVAGSGNVISGNGLQGIYIVGTNGVVTGNLIQGNIVGLNAAGTGALANSDAGVGIFGSSANQIGGTLAAGRNVLSGNVREGLFLKGPGASNNIVQGNFIGTDASGTIDLRNYGPGILLDKANINQIGGTISGARNLVSANYKDAIFLTNSSWNVIQGNLVGTKIDGTSPLGNLLHGVDLELGSSNNIIGGTTVGAGNVLAYAQTYPLVSGSGYCGVRVRTGAFNNLISGNAIFNNNGLGIDLGAYGTNANIHLQAGVASTDANRLQNYPVLTNAVSGTATRIRGKFDGALNKSYTLEFFASPAGDASGNGEGQLFLGQASVSVGSLSPTNFSITLPATVPAGWVISATATDSTNNTSEFSNWVATWTVPQVRIVAAVSPTICTLSWTNAGGSYVLMQSTNLASPQWFSTGFNALTNGVYAFPVSATNPASFFRLQAL